jgi:methylthioribose-1-phosphate isomerase
MIRAIGWRAGEVRLLDQRRLPGREEYLACRNVEQLSRAIETLAVRGAPLIGIAGAYGLVLGIWHSRPGRLEGDFRRSYLRIARTRPTAVNLFWALDRMSQTLGRLKAQGAPQRTVRAKLLDQARRIHREDRETCLRIGLHGARLMARGSAVLTHCNTGGLATGGIGTALGVIATAYREGRIREVLVDETRPLLQGARLTAWELKNLKIPASLICDNMAAGLMARGKVDCAIVGADRICANGDFANKTGTYGLAVSARHHGVPFYVAAPLSSFDPRLPSGRGIPIEQRDPSEVCALAGRRIAPSGFPALNPSFDVTPGRLVTAFITERGVLKPPFGPAIRAIMRQTPGK